MLYVAVNEGERRPSPRFDRDSFETRSRRDKNGVEVLRCGTERAIGDAIATGSLF